MSFLALLKLIFAPARILEFGGKAFKFIVTYWKQIIVVGMMLTIFYQNFMHVEFLKWVGVRTIPGITQEYQTTLKTKEDQLKTCEEGRAKLTGAINTLNSQVDKWATLSTQLQAQQDKLVVELAKMRKKAEHDVQEILNGPTPKTCDDAIKYLKDAAGELKW